MNEQICDGIHSPYDRRTHSPMAIYRRRRADREEFASFVLAISVNFSFSFSFSLPNIVSQRVGRMHPSPPSPSRVRHTPSYSFWNFYSHPLIGTDFAALSDLPCPAGTYQDEEGQSQCKVCPSGKTPSRFLFASVALVKYSLKILPNRNV
jgi:hypothetical protein